jgi:hypothetical protein
MTTSPSWPTLDDLDAACERFEAAIPGWRRPAAHALVLRQGDEVEIIRLNVDGRHLPCVVLATVCGHANGSAAYDLSTEQFDRAIELLTPADACTDVDHPNLWAWRALRPRSSMPTAVFVADLAEKADDPTVEAVRLAAGSSQR